MCKVAAKSITFVVSSSFRLTIRMSLNPVTNFSLYLVLLTLSAAQFLSFYCQHNFSLSVTSEEEQRHFDTFFEVCSNTNK